MVNPNDLLLIPPTMHKKRRKGKKKTEKLKLDKKIKILKNFSSNNKSFNIDIAYKAAFEEVNETAVGHEHWDYGKNMTYDEEKENKRKKMKQDKWNVFIKVDPPPITSTDYQSSDGYFCESPSKYIVIFIVNVS